MRLTSLWTNSSTKTIIIRAVIINKATPITTNLDKIPGLLALLTTTSTTTRKDNKATIVAGTIIIESTIIATTGITTKDLDSTLITAHFSSTAGTTKEISIRTIGTDLMITKEVIGATFQVAQDRITIITGLTLATTTDKIDREMNERRYLLRNTNKRWKEDDFLCQI